MFAWLKEIIHSLLFALSAFFRQETRYELSKRVVRTERLIGEGGFSYVYLVRDVADHKLFALKAIRAQTEEQLQKAMEEASIHSQLRHPNLLRLEDSAVISDVHIRTNEAPYKLVLLLFPFYSKGNLAVLRRQMLEQGIYFEEAMLLRMFRSVCRGIDYLHSHEPRWSHGDIKLDNLLLKENGDVILMDFGSISAARKEISDRKQALQLQDWASEHCTIFYRAPELFDVPSRCFIDERTDIWSLGCLLYAMAFGSSPFEKAFYETGGSVALAATSGKYILPSKKDGNPYSNDISELLSWLINSDPSKRPFIKEVLLKLNLLLNEEHIEINLSQPSSPHNPAEKDTLFS